jgi:hypothetical protein
MNIERSNAMKYRFIKAAFIAVLLPGLAIAEESGFLEDYSILGPDGAYGNARMFVAEGTLERMANYSKVMIDQPLIYIDPDSKSKGMKPDTMTAIAEMLRSAVSDAVSEQYQVVEEKGEGVLYFRWAVTNMYLQKPKRGVLSFTPVGAVAYAAKSGLSDFVDKNTLVDLRLEGELLDSVTGEVFVALTLDRGQRKDKWENISEDPASWEELFAVGTALGQRFGCRLNNSRTVESERVDCAKIKLGE